MIKIRLKKHGKKGQPFYRIVAMDNKTKRNGRCLEELGFYNPITSETYLKFEQITRRLNQGAYPSKTVGNILQKAKISRL
jgi:small subunit ribosomal protein S16